MDIQLREGSSNGRSGTRGWIKPLSAKLALQGCRSRWGATGEWWEEPRAACRTQPQTPRCTAIHSPGGGQRGKPGLEGRLTCQVGQLMRCTADLHMELPQNKEVDTQCRVPVKPPVPERHTWMQPPRGDCLTGSVWEKRGRGRALRDSEWPQCGGALARPRLGRRGGGEEGRPEPAAESPPEGHGRWTEGPANWHGGRWRRVRVSIVPGAGSRGTQRGREEPAHRAPGSQLHF